MSERRWAQLTAPVQHELSPAGFGTLDQFNAMVMEGLSMQGADVEDPATLVAMDSALAAAQALAERFPLLSVDNAVRLTRSALRERARALPTPPFTDT